MQYKSIAGSGALSMSYLKPRLGGSDSLRQFCASLGLAAPDVLPDDFYNQNYMQMYDDVTYTSVAATHNGSGYAIGPWTVSSNAGWLTVTSSSGTGPPASPKIQLTENTGSTRVGTLTLTQTLSSETMTQVITQTGVSATLTISPTSRSTPSGGETFTITITTTGSPTWTVTDSATWISVSPTSGTGNGSLSVTVQSNTGSQRFGSVTVNWSGASRTCAITQDSGGIQ